MWAKCSVCVLTASIALFSAGLAAEPSHVRMGLNWVAVAAQGHGEHSASTVRYSAAKLGEADYVHEAVIELSGARSLRFSYRGPERFLDRDQILLGGMGWSDGFSQFESAEVLPVKLLRSLVSGDGALYDALGRCADSGVFEIRYEKLSDDAGAVYVTSPSGNEVRHAVSLPDFAVNRSLFEAVCG